MLPIDSHLFDPVTRIIFTRWGNFGATVWMLSVLKGDRRLSDA